MKLHTHARDVKTAGPPLLHRAPLLLCPGLPRSHFLSVTLSPISALSLPLDPSHPSRRLPLDYLTDKGYVNGDIRVG